MPGCRKVFNDNWSIKVAKEKANFLAEKDKDTLEQVPEERGRKGSMRRNVIHFPKREKSNCRWICLGREGGSHRAGQGAVPLPGQQGIVARRMR